MVKVVLHLVIFGEAEKVAVLHVHEVFGGSHSDGNHFGNGIVSKGAHKKGE